jgi:hypothetical protein
VLAAVAGLSHMPTGAAARFRRQGS